VNLLIVFHLFLTDLQQKADMHLPLLYT